MAEVVMKDLKKVYNHTVTAVDDFNLNVENREFMVLVGPSGCGKSTTLRMVAGLEEITDGTVSIDNRIVNEVPPKHRNIAMVFQNYALYPHMSVFDNMAFGLKLRKFPKSEIKSRVDNAGEILGIKNLLERKPKELSGGQRQRVAVGRAIVRNPKVFLFDEPLSNLDAKMRVQMRTEISKLHNRLEATMLYVTHDQVEAMTMGDRICVMNDGFIQQVDTPVTIYDNPANLFVAGFIGTPPMNLFYGRLSAGENGLKFTDGTSVIPIPDEWKQHLGDKQDKSVVFGIRPEDIGNTKDVDKNSMPCIKATVEVVEPMGSETYIYLTTGKTKFIARIESKVKVDVDQELELPINMQKAHIFDGETENLII